MLKLCLQISEFLVEELHPHQHDVLRLQRAATLHVEEELVWFAEVVVVGLVHVLVLNLRVLGLQPLLRLGEERVPQRVVRVILETHSGCGVPLGMFLRESLLGVCSHLEYCKSALQVHFMLQIK